MVGTCTLLMLFPSRAIVSYHVWAFITLQICLP